MVYSHIFRVFSVFVLCLSLVACSTTHDTTLSSQGIYDPLEGTNRAVFAFNNGVDEAVIDTTVRGYRSVVPGPARSGLRNVLRNVQSPVIFANQVLQGDAEGAKNVLLRASINTLVGFGGVFDFAGAEGIPYEPEDFGQTLAVWGVGHGPYLVLPFFGGVSLRNAGGIGVDGLSDPLSRYWNNIDEDHLNYTRFGLGYLDLKDSLYDSLRDLEGNSFDPYAAVRSAYYQNRSSLISDNGRLLSADVTSSFDEFY